MFWQYLLGITCPVLPNVDRSKVYYKDTLSGVEVTYVCNYAHHFPDGTDSITIICQTDGTWSDIPPNCKGMRPTF